MGDKTLDPTANEFEEDAECYYKIKSYKALELPIEFRNLIMGPFLNSLRYGNDFFKLVDKSPFYEHYAKYIDLLLKRDGCYVKLAMLSDDTVLGWCLLERKQSGAYTVHYVWVKEHLRRNGIAKALLPNSFDTISHVTNKGINIWVSKYPEVKFDPWA